MRVSIKLELRGPLAEAWFDEWQKRQRKNPNLAKTQVTRDMLAEHLAALGHNDVQDTVEWGGYRERSEDAHAGHA